MIIMLNIWCEADKIQFQLFFFFSYLNHLQKSKTDHFWSLMLKRIKFCYYTQSFFLKEVSNVMKLLYTLWIITSICYWATLFRIPFGKLLSTHFWKEWPIYDFKKIIKASWSIIRELLPVVIYNYFFFLKWESN